MSRFEIFLTIMFIAVPFISLLMISPKKLLKRIKQNKKAKTKTEIKEEIKKEEPKKEEFKPKVEERKESKISTSEISSEEFKEYLKRRNVTKPARIDLPDGFEDKTLPYLPRRRKINYKPKNIAEEIQSLSPELKALIIAGVLDKKDFDN